MPKVEMWPASSGGRIPRLPRVLEIPQPKPSPLEEAVDACQHPVELQDRVPGGNICRFCDELWGEQMTPADAEQWNQQFRETAPDE
jgi:hypothetical protein